MSTPRLPEEQVRDIESIRLTGRVFSWRIGGDLSANEAVFLLVNQLLAAVEERGDREHRDRVWVVIDTLTKQWPLFGAEVRSDLRRSMRRSEAKIPYHRSEDSPKLEVS